jgi:hypothetical protein
MKGDHYTLTPEEQAKLEWCYSLLSEEQIADCYDRASEFAVPESQQAEAAEFLEGLIAMLIINNLRADFKRGE